MQDGSGVTPRSCGVWHAHETLGNMQVHMGLQVTYRAPSGCHVGTHETLGHVRFTLRVPCRHTWGSRSIVVHPGATMQAHIGILSHVDHPHRAMEAVTGHWVT